MEHYKSDIEDQEYQIKIYQRFNLKPNRENVGLVSKSRLILFAINLKLHTTAFAFMKLCRCFYLVFIAVVDLFVFA